MTLYDPINFALDQNGVVLLPTETVFGLACRATDPIAINKIYAIKGRGFDKPLAVCISNLEQAETFAVFNKTARQIAKQYWPGSVTIILKAKSNTGLDPRCLSGVKGSDSVALRCPAIEWRDHLKTPLALTSANHSGEPDCIDHGSALALFEPEVDAHLETETVLSGQPSTIISIDEIGCHVIRQGTVKLPEFLS